MFTIQLNSIQTIKENIMTYFNGTLQEFTYLHEQVTEISNPDESYLGTFQRLLSFHYHYSNWSVLIPTFIEY